VLGRGEDLGRAADHYFERRDVAGHEGTFGVLTNGVVTREEAFARSMLHALAPFYNAVAYSLH
jgi:non-canonical (house-cleaning) NTP pyrophosphatase